MKRILLAATLALAGCAPTPGDHYTLVVDLNLPDRFMNAAYQGMDNWQSILDGKLSITIDTTGTCHNVDHEICVHASTKAWIDANGANPGAIGYTIHYPMSDRADVYMPVVDDSGESDAALLQTTSHELGHAIALSHTQPGTLMCGDQSCAALIPTCDDADQYMVVHAAFTGDKWAGNKSCPNGGNYTLTGN